MDTDFEDKNEENSPIDDPSPESLNAQQDAVEQPSNAVKEVGYEDTTNNREIIQDAVAFQMDQSFSIGLSELIRMIWHEK